VPLCRLTRKNKRADAFRDARWVDNVPIVRLFSDPHVYKTKKIVRCLFSFLTACSSMKYKAWRSNSDKDLHLGCREGGFEDLPQHIRSLGPWSGSREGDIDKLKLHYRLQIMEQGFTIVQRHVLAFSLEHD
jgi:hypothetical protein